MARTAEDNALMLNVMAGFDPKDSTSIDREVPDYTATLNEPLKGLKIGLPKEYFSDQLSPAMEETGRAVHEEAVLADLLADLGGHPPSGGT